MQGVNYLYNSPWYDFQRGFIKVGEVMSGNYYWGSSPYMTLTVNSTDADLTSMSNSLWSVIGHANTVYNNLKGASASQAVKTERKGLCGECLRESRSQFVYKDNRNILFDFDGSHGGLAGGHGWRPGRIRTGGIDGSYLYLGGAAILGKVGATWDEDDFAMNYWPEPSAGFPELTAIPSFANMLDTCDIDDLALKFECRVPETSPWSASALQLIFTGNLYAAGGSQGGGFTYVAEGLTGAFRAIAPSITGHADFEEGMRIVNWPRANFLAAKEKLGMTDDEMNTFNAYFDVMNFASCVTCPVISCFSLQDTTDPVRTNLAPFNLLDKVKEDDKVYIINPFLGHATPAGWGKRYMEFFEKHHSDRTPAAIRQTTSSTAGDTCAVCFDMTGRRVSVPGRGLYITGGRKLVMR